MAERPIIQLADGRLTLSVHRHLALQQKLDSFQAAAACCKMQRVVALGVLQAIQSGGTGICNEPWEDREPWLLSRFVYGRSSIPSASQRIGLEDNMSLLCPKHEMLKGFAKRGVADGFCLGHFHKASMRAA